MPDRTCSVDGCTGITGIPGTARGWCSAHYHRWQRYGDPLGEREYRNKGKTCSVEDCDKPAAERGWCSAHYSRWQRYGSLEHPEAWGRAPEGQRWCAKCQTYKPLNEFSPDASKGDGERRTTCKACCRRGTAHWRRRNPDKVAAQIAKDRGPNRYRRNARSRRSAAKARVEGRGRPSNRRARYRERKYETFTRLEIAERDGWRCQICGKRIGKTYRWPHPRSLSIDHIIPIDHGGDHMRSNVQATHLRCNLSKQTKGTDQLRLIG